MSDGHGARVSRIRSLRSGIRMARWLLKDKNGCRSDPVKREMTISAVGLKLLETLSGTRHEPEWSQ